MNVNQEKLGDAMTIDNRKEIAMARRKTWDECGIEERQERLRDELRSQRNYLNNVLGRVENQVTKMESHTHGANGELLVPLLLHGLGEMDQIRGHDPLE